MDQTLLRLLCASMTLCLLGALMASVDAYEATHGRPMSRRPELDRASVDAMAAIDGMPDADVASLPEIMRAAMAAILTVMEIMPPKAFRPGVKSAAAGLRTLAEYVLNSIDTATPDPTTGTPVGSNVTRH